MRSCAPMMTITETVNGTRTTVTVIIVVKLKEPNTKCNRTEMNYANLFAEYAYVVILSVY